MALEVLGELDRAEEHLQDALETAQKQDERCVVGWCYWLRAEIGRTRGIDGALVEQSLQQAEAIARELSLVALAKRCEEHREPEADAPR